MNHCRLRVAFDDRAPARRRTPLARGVALALLAAATAVPAAAALADEGDTVRLERVTAKPIAGRSLAVRLKDNESALLEAYRAIAGAVGEGRTVTPAAEWLLDNYHLVDAQIREIRDDLPPGYYRHLPKLAAGPFAGYPRVFGVAWAFVAHTDSRFDPAMLRPAPQLALYLGHELSATHRHALAPQRLPLPSALCRAPSIHSRCVWPNTASSTPSASANAPRYKMP